MAAAKDWRTAVGPNQMPVPSTATLSANSSTDRTWIVALRLTFASWVKSGAGGGRFGICDHTVSGRVFALPGERQCVINAGLVYFGIAQARLVVSLPEILSDETLRGLGGQIAHARSRGAGARPPWAPRGANVELTSQLGLRIPAEVLHWWAWQDGIPRDEISSSLERRLGRNEVFITLTEALSLTTARRELVCSLR